MRTLPAFNVLFEWFLDFHILKTLNLHVLKSVLSLNCPKFIKICSFLSIKHARPAFLNWNSKITLVSAFS